MFDTIVAIVFVALLGLFLYFKRSKLELRKILFPFLYVFMYRSEFGLLSMDRWARKLKRFFKIAGVVGIYVGFIGMVLMAYQLIYSTISNLLTPAESAVQLVLPIQAKGVFFVPFSHWILSIFVIAVVHEFAHGVIARAHNIPLKSTGFAFFSIFVPLIPAAFVEPDDTTLMNRNAKEQLSVYAAGPFANVILAILFFGLVFLVAPFTNSMFTTSGVEVVSILDNSSAKLAGLSEGDIIVEVDDQEILSVQNLTSYLKDHPLDEELVLQTTNDKFVFTPDIKDNLTVLGVTVSPFIEVKDSFAEEYPVWVAHATKWFTGLFVWIALLSLGIGLFNLLPLGPLDGGHMSRVALQKFIPDKKVALKIWGYITLFFVMLIFINLLIGFF